MYMLQMLLCSKEIILVVHPNFSSCRRLIFGVIIMDIVIIGVIIIIINASDPGADVCRIVHQNLLNGGEVISLFLFRFVILRFYQYG